MAATAVAAPSVSDGYQSDSIAGVVVVANFWLTKRLDTAIGRPTGDSDWAR